jgi:hypothetical protein
MAMAWRGSALAQGATMSARRAASATHADRTRLDSKAVTRASYHGVIALD